VRFAFTQSHVLADWMKLEPGELQLFHNLGDSEVSIIYGFDVLRLFH
jgi:hypothetical protein